jgi:muramoyltetrapeptide carboxypeptidase
MNDEQGLRLPPALNPGDTVAVVATSSPVTSDEIQRLEDYFTARGYRVKLGEHVRAATGYLAGPAKERAHDLMAAFADPNVKLIIPASGGKGAAQFLNLLDMNAIRENPTIFTGISDPSIVCNAITTGAGVATLHGPSGFDFFQPEVNTDTESAFWRIVSGPVSGISITDPSWQPLQGTGRTIKGRVFGGHLGVNRTLLGTKDLPDLTGAILLIEEVFAPYARIDEALTHLRLAGVFDQIAALIVGVPVECSPEDSPDTGWEDMILRCVGDACPILVGVEFGHTARKVPFVIGGSAEIKLADGASTITYLSDLDTG